MFHEDVVESPPPTGKAGLNPRGLMGDVVRQKRRHIQICVHVWNNPSTVKHQEVLRQSLDCKDTGAPLDVWRYCKSRAAIWCGKAPICWSTGGTTTQEAEERKDGKRKAVERSCVHLMVLSA